MQLRKGMAMENRVFIDTNVLIDVFVEREDFYTDSAAIWMMAETNQIQGFISAISYNNINYFLTRISTKQKARKAMLLLRDIFDTVPLDQKILNRAIDGDFKDFEDAIQYHSAISASAICLITRNKKDFKKSDIPILAPTEFLALYSFN